MNVELDVFRYLLIVYLYSDRMKFLQPHIDNETPLLSVPISLGISFVAEYLDGGDFFIEVI